MKQNKHVINLGNLKLENRYFLAPMHQINNIAFRILCKQAGAGLTYTELTSPESKAKIHLEDKPAIQLVCNKDKGIKSFIKKYNSKVSLWDLNLGCPSPHAKKSGVGYFMNKDLKAIEQVLKTMRASTKKPVTIKIRKMPLPHTKKIIKIAEKYCDAISVHPRTCGQGYAGLADESFALKVKKSTKLPVIYSGDIQTKEHADLLLEKFDFIMIGRAAIGNPEIFSELTESKTKIKFNDYLKLADKYDVEINHIKLYAMRSIKGQPGSSDKRRQLSSAKTIKEIKKILSK